jgi:hypothetical protein
VIWDFLFENQVEATSQGIVSEVQRLAGGDPRLFVSQINIFPQDNGVLIELLLQQVSTTNAEILSIFFDQQTRNASYV